MQQPYLAVIEFLRPHCCQQDARHKVRIAKLCHQHCLELISEMEVQSKAIDSARSSVETHYNYIHSQLSAFDER